MLFAYDSTIIHIIFITLSFILETVQLFSLGSCFKMIFSDIFLSFEKCGCTLQAVLHKSVPCDFWRVKISSECNCIKPAVNSKGLCYCLYLN